MMEDLIIRMTVREFIVPLSGTVNSPSWIKPTTCAIKRMKRSVYRR
jgi:hypothetical protein